MKHAPIKEDRCYVVAILVLCMCIAMQVLGAPIMLWDPQSEVDRFGGAVSEGFSIPAAVFIISHQQPYRLQDESPHLVQSTAFAESLFRPPAFS
jgi:hypothetical protein